MRLQGKLNYNRPNHPPRLADRVQKSAQWQRWKRAMAALDAHGVGAKEAVR
jgi:hypothetical protein